MTVQLQVSKELAAKKLPKGVAARLNGLLDKQDSGVTLTSAERREAEGLVELAEFLSLLNMRAGRTRRTQAA